jgi:putative Holliday junction resolvase
MGGRMMAFQRGRRLGVDVGKVRVGVALCDPDGILATPLVTLSRDNALPQEGAAADSVPADIAELVRLVKEHEAVQIVVGLPVRLNGAEGPAAIDIRAYADRLARAVGQVPIVLTDERMSTVVATRRLAERGVRGKRQRAVVDQAAAVEILQSWLDAQRRQTQ